jgi:uncharacterized protein (DUF1330 family)
MTMTGEPDPGAALAAEVRALRDTQEVVDALDRFGAGQDLCDERLFRSAFAPNATLDFPQPANRFGAEIPVMRGQDAIAGILTTLQPLATTHTVTNPRVELRGDPARLWAMVEARHVVRCEPAPTRAAEEHLRRRPCSARRRLGQRDRHPKRLARRRAVRALRGGGVSERRQRPAPRAYWINTFRAVHDPARLAAYVELAGPAMLAAGGRFLARGKPAAAFESGAVERTTLIEFPSLDAAVAAYHSPAYQQALAALGDGAERDIRIVEAIDDPDRDQRGQASA